MNSGPSGFYNAPVTKAIILTSAGLSLLGGLHGTARLLSLSYECIFRRHELWRLLTSATIFSSTPEILFGLYLVYFFRIFERQVGSNKYTIFALSSTILSTAFQLASLVALEGRFSGDLLTLCSGPYGLIFASFVPFFFDIPVSARFSVMSLKFSDKSFVYLAGLQLLLSSGRQSIIPGISGLLAGLTYRSNVFGIRRLKFPDFISSFVERTFSFLISRTPPTASGGRVAGPGAPGTGPTIARRLGGPSQGFSDQLIGGNGGLPGGPFLAPQTGLGVAATAAASPAPPPPEEAVQTLVSMGFDRSQAVRALAQARNDVHMATNLLLEGVGF
ncbi:hypothetical protein KFL_007760080 [Klebsormidium nitens]|uniref:UBA domain-containing protein n=1 Tax=Klebsormidium nitens TaxID=105231 RepID=A0A1Y1IPG5_KLENI|nr:hypothetical protein KFL_007760080 [Klebsormidium nitens]|eukprot:GAQ91389.1 hypothetical protein KFL_007760080 [Klebsormidium nitens]